MSFARPGLLWLLALAVPLVLFHLRMRRSIRVTVPSLLAWDPDVLGASSPRAAGLRPRDLLALLLECGALAALVLAAAGPTTGGEAADTRPLVLILDGSASTMAAGRFEEERALAGRALAAAAPTRPVTLVLAAGEPRVLATAGQPRAEVEAALAAAKPRPVGGGGLAPSRGLPVAGSEALVFTDGCGREASLLVSRPGFQVVSVGRPERNAAIVGFSADLPRGGPERLFVRVLGPDGKVREVDRSALLRVDGAWRAGAPLRVAVDPPLAGDALPLDDAIELRLRPAGPLRVAVAAPGGRVDPYLAAALESCGDALDAAVSTAVDPAALDRIAARPDVLVLAGGEVPSPVPALVLGAGTGATDEVPEVRVGERLHPVLRGVDPAEWIVTRGRTLEARPGDAVLLHGPRGPLALAGERDGARRVILGFDPRESTVPLTASWPVFLRNALLWLAEAGENRASAAAAPGALLDAAESDLEPRIPRNADAFAPAAFAAHREPRPLAGILAAAGAALLLAEWLLFALAGAAAARVGRDSFSPVAGVP